MLPKDAIESLKADWKIMQAEVNDQREKAEVDKENRTDQVQQPTEEEDINLKDMKTLIDTKDNETTATEAPSEKPTSVEISQHTTGDAYFD